MVEAEVLPLKRAEVLKLPDFGFWERMEKTGGWIKKEVKTPKAFLGKLKECIQGNVPEEVEAIFRKRRGEKVDVRQLIESLRVDPQTSRIAEYLAGVYAATLNPETRYLTPTQVVQAFAATLGVIKERKYLPASIVGQIEESVLEPLKAQAEEALEQEAAKELKEERERGGKIAPSGGKRPKKKETRREEEEKRSKWWWVTPAILFLASGAFCCKGMWIAEKIGAGIQGVREHKVKAINFYHGRVLEERRRLATARMDVESRNVINLYDESISWMDKLTDAKISHEEFEEKISRFRNVPDYYRLGIGMGWLDTLNREGYVVERKVNGKKLKEDLLKLGYPTNLVNQFLGKLQEWTGEVEGVGWLSREESLGRIRQQQVVARAKIRGIPAPTKGLRRRKGA